MPKTFQRSRPTIGVLAGWQFYRTATNLSYLLPVFRGINRAARELGCSLLLGCGMGASASPADPPRPAWPFPAPDVDFVPIGPWNTDGLLIFTPLHSLERTAQVQELIAAGHPVLFIGSGESGPTIAADNQGGVLEAVGHLVQHGHRRIAFIAGSPDDLNGDTGERLQAYQAALQSFGLEADPLRVAYGRHVYDGGYSALQQLLKAGADFSAVLASNDESALGAIQALKEAGRRIPEDIAVIGFDNRHEGAALNPALSSVHVPLFSMGYQALAQLLQLIEGRAALPEIIRMDTRLVVRQSCGCRRDHSVGGAPKSAGLSASPAPAAAPAGWIASIAMDVLSEAQNLEEKECRALCKRLVDSFALSRAGTAPGAFLEVLEEVLRQTVLVEDDAHIWQEAVSRIGGEFDAVYLPGRLDPPAVRRVAALLNQARLAISAQMQKQHRQYVSDQRWVSSRVSLLTASLLTALDETQIYKILAQHLPVMDIRLALIALFEGEDRDPLAWSSLRNALADSETALRIASRDFPPQSLFPPEKPFHLVLIPITDQTGELGYAVFGTEYIDLYGAIVQQLGGALNTARLYRQATEGRRLAEEANRMKSRFLSTISHELRTPLNLIVGLSGMVLRASEEGEVPLPEPAQKDVERIYTYSQHLGGLIGDVIDLATSDAGQLRLNCDFIDLGKSLQIVAESGRQLANDKGLAWEAQFPENGAWVWGDQTRLRQVALNLINNAVKFTERGGVSLRLEVVGDSVSVQVSDTGLGISADEQQVIFAEFRQSERSVALGYGGLGLGLAISKRLVEMHGGSIGVYSSGKEGAGSTFFFSLPAAQLPKAQSRQDEIQPKNEQSVLVLTNRPAASERLCRQVNQRGYKVQVTTLDAPLAWQEKLDPLPDAILLDVSIASSHSWDVLKSIKESPTASQVPVLFYKSSQEDGSILELDYLTKPIELAELTRALDQQWLMAEGDQSGRTILVVDDDANTLDLHARIVQAHSASNRVLKANNGQAALETMESEPVDLVLLDLQMPGLDGFSVLEKMRASERTARIPVIVVTGKVLSEADMARLNRGVAAVLEKGLFSLDETAAHISAALDRKRRLSSEAQRLVRKAMAYIHEHYADSISRQEIARYVNIAEDHLTFCFRQELGTTPIEYIQRYRVQQARRLLKESDRPITQIALDVGFSDSGYFSRIFRRITGMSPESFRRA